MGDWQYILKELNEECPMDYCKEFAEVKSVFDHCIKHVKYYADMNSGNYIPELLHQIKKRMQTAFIRWGCVTEDLKALPEAYPIFRKVVMLLILNTDLSNHINLKEHNNIAHVINFNSRLPKFLLISTIWELKLDQLFYESISYTPIWLTGPLMQEVLNSFRDMNEYEIMEKGEHMVCCMLKSLTNVQFYVRTPICSMQKNIYFTKMTVKIVKKTFELPKMEDENQGMSDGRCLGYRIRHVLHALTFAMNAYLNPTDCRPGSEFDFYQIFPRQRWTRTYKDRAYHSFRADIVELQIQIIQALLDALEHNMCALNSDIISSWTEIAEPKRGNLRRELGELAYNLKENIAPLNHSVYNKLDIISLRVDNIDEKLQKSTLSEILTHLSSKETDALKKPWFDEFLIRDTSIDIVKYTTEIKKHRNLMSFENCKAVLAFISEHLKSAQMNNHSNQFKEEEDHSNTYVELTSIILATLNQCSDKEIIEILRYQRELFGVEVCICQSNDFGFRSTEFFNKEFELKTFLLLCVENPSQMWKKYFEIEWYNAAQITNFCETVKNTSPFCDEYFDQYLNELLMEPLRLQQKQFPSFLCEIYFKLFCQERKMDFLKGFVYKSVSKYITLEDFKSLLPFVYTLNKISNHGDTHSAKQQNFGEITAPVLIMTVQILECARWDFDTYTEVRNKLVQETINFICTTSKKFLPVASQKDRDWIANYISNSHNLSQYYFQKFSLPKNVLPQSFEDYIIRDKLENAEEEKTMLLYFLARLTAKETELLLRTNRFLQHLPITIVILGNLAKKTESLNNYKNCIVNYANFVQKILLPRYEENPSEINEILINTLHILKYAPDAAYATLFLDLENLLLTLTKKTLFLRNQQEVLKQRVMKMKDCNAKELYLKKLETLHNEV